MPDGLELYVLKCPDLSTIEVNKKYLLSVKIGGEYQLKAIRRTSCKAYEVDVFGYGFRKTVSTKKLREKVYG